MITNHSAQTYSLTMHAKYRMSDFEEIKHHKASDCHYSVAHTRHFKRITIDNEVSPKSQFETWIDGVYYIIKMDSVSYVTEKRAESMNVNVRVTAMHDVEYTDYYGSINDTVNFEVKSGAITPVYMLTYGLAVFDHHKESIIQQLHQGMMESRLHRLFEGDGIWNYFHP